MAKTQKRAVGDIGEAVARRYLESKGFIVLEQNYWKPWGEIDIVSQKGSILRFIEVKTIQSELGRENASHETVQGNGSREPIRPEENMHSRKLERLHRTIQSYLEEKRLGDREWQIDLACVYLDFGTKKAKVELLENIVL